MLVSVCEVYMVCVVYVGRCMWCVCGVCGVCVVYVGRCVWCECGAFGVCGLVCGWCWTAFNVFAALSLSSVKPMSLDSFLRKLPSNVVKDGRLISVRQDIQQTLLVCT